MNDPHVNALLYDVVHDSRVEYNNAKALEAETDSFNVTVKGGMARFEPKQHFADPNEAQAALEPAIRSWEIATCLDYDPGEFELVYRTAEVIDRKPTAGSFALVGIQITATGNAPKPVVGRSQYPKPVFSLGISTDVEDMYRRFEKYRRGRDTLPGVAHFCLDVLQARAGDRPKAAQKFRISLAVLRKLGDLAARKGGPDARKSAGRAFDYTDAERSWIDKVLRRLILRVAEVEADPTQELNMIDMTDFPPLDSA